MEALPACALTCLAHAAAAANCSVTDIACACENEVFMSYATPCIAGTCTVREAFFTKNQTSVQCDVPPYVNKRFVPVIISFFVLTFIVVSLRIATRVVSQAKFWYDDYFNFAAFVTISIYTWADVALSQRGFGVDIWAVPQENISYILIFLLVGSVLYFTSRALIRVSILLFYLRIFRAPGAKAAITGTLTLVGLFSFTLLFPIVFQCSPVDYLWLQWDGTHKGHCQNFRVFVWTATSIGIALDLWTVLLACILVSGLQLPPKKKILVYSMFTVGLVAIAVSIARLPYINQFTVTTNPTIDWVPISIWSALENYIGVICACLPSLPALFKPLSAMKIPRSIKRSNLSRSFPSQTQALEYELNSRQFASAYEMPPTYMKATDAYHDGRIIIASSPRMYHSFNDSDREI
ncbi:hypothetical protein GGS24DRAFT_510521 [Hypoxylon argillaceum]|nr:hypothetical protein GGS24DRAFT_510521 [Hypoxylon argillaceum]